MQRNVTIIGAGILGLWQALILARRGAQVRLLEATNEPFANAASRYAGTLLAPDCEFLRAQQSARAFARAGLKYWQDNFSNVETRGTLVVAQDPADLQDHANQADNFTHVASEDIVKLEPALGARFRGGLFFQDEAHIATDTALTDLLNAIRQAGVAISFGTPYAPADDTCDDIVIDCRGMAARDLLPDLRGVRGEQMILKTDAIALSRPIRLLHLRQPIYVVPRGGDHYMVGATAIETEDQSQMSVKSALDLLTLAYQLHPAFGEAEIISLGAGVRPAFPENLPRIIVREGGRKILVNGAYRHGFLLAPVLAEATADYLDDGRVHPWLHVNDAPCAQDHAL